MILGAFALGSIALWIVFASTLKPACSEGSRQARDAQARGAPGMSALEPNRNRKPSF
jgi:hypothetical protein